MALAYRLALRHRLGLDDLAAVLARLRVPDPADPFARVWATNRVVELLREDPGLDRAALRTLAPSLAGQDVAALRWALVDAGLVTEALAVPVGSRASHLHAIDDRLAAGKPVPDAIIEHAVALVDGVDAEQDLLLAILAAKVLGPWLEPTRRAAHLATLRALAADAEAAGAWDELDYAYGTVDPALELARALAHGGDEATVDGLLDRRAARYPRLLNLEEARELHALCRARAAAHRAATWERCRVWAGDDLDGDGTPGEQVAWLVETVDEPWADAAARLAALVPRLAVQGLAHIATAARGRPLGDTAEHALVPQLVTAVERIRAPDAASKARALRDTSTAAWALARARALSADEEATVARAAATWAGWVAGVDTGDWNPLVNTALSFARRWRGAVEAGAARLRAEDAAGRVRLLDHEDWALLYEPAEVRVRCAQTV